jgi:dynein heavy chain
MGRSKLQHSCERLLDGVRKLNETEALVTSMKADLARLQPVLEAKAAATAELLTKARHCTTGLTHCVVAGLLCCI